VSEPYIKHFFVQNFGCVINAPMELTRLHALIGPNDSGKTTLMRALRTALQFSSGVFSVPAGARSRGVEPFDPGLDLLAPFHLNISTADALGGDAVYGIGRSERTSHLEEFVTLNGATLLQGPRNPLDDPGGLADRPKHPVFSAIELLRRSPRWLHFNPSAMRGDGKLFFEDEPKILDPSASRLPAIYDAILNRGDDTFLRIADEVRRFFPPIKHIRLKNVAQDTKAFEVELTSGQLVPASFISDGVLYYLAFAALEHMAPASVLLIEEPENGLHPARIADVMKVLRRISERVQVILTTHSPFVINELQGDEVTVVTRPDGQGTRVRRLCDTPNFEERSKVYALGELWVSYADGKNEEPLLAEVEGGS
jgi:energy-coupling factor transporter ATP-binding protein EcfA2